MGTTNEIHTATYFSKKYLLKKKTVFNYNTTQIFVKSTIFVNLWKNLPGTEAGAQRCSVKKLFLKVLQNSQETLVPDALFK